MSKAEAWRERYPFASRYLPTPSGRLHFVDEGPRDARPVLMVHGNPTWSFYYRELIELLRGTRRCLAWDHIGCGLSEKPEHIGGGLELHIDIAQRLIDSLNLGSFDLAVHDWGGAIGLGLAARMPERIGRILIMNTAAFPSHRLPLRIRVCRWPGLGEFLLLRGNAFLRAALRMAVRNRLEPEVISGYRFPFRKRSGRLAALRFVRDIPMREDHPSMPALRQVERGLAHLADKPILICWGLRDFCFNRHFLEEWRNRMPEAEVMAFDNAGHWVLEDARLEVLRAARTFFNQDLQAEASRR
ncbi:MAG: alpha/beta fold hydrolase [Opitutales bacterium]